MYKMVVTDLDDTLLLNNKKISEFTLFMFNQLKEKGIKLAFATGRSHHNAMELVPKGLFDGTIAQNGAVAYVNNEVVHYLHISPSDTRDIMLKAREHGIISAAETASITYSYTDLSNSRISWITNYMLVEDDYLCEEVERILFHVNDDIELKLKDIAFLEEHMPDTVGYVVGRDGYAQIMKKEATKLEGVKALCDYFGISINEVVAFGDDTNDISMIKGCGKGIAMQNALAVVKDIADEICDTNEYDGMAKWIFDNIKDFSNEV